jgi:hypothetical protein
MQTMDADLALLTRVLGVTDAAFLPIRSSEWQHPRPAGVYLAQLTFRRHGVALPQGGGVAERKAAERTLDRLLADGRLLGRRRGRGYFLRLPDKTEDELRHRIGLPGLGLSFETARRLLTDWVPETSLNGGRGWGDGCGRELVFVESLLLPALARGFAESGSDIQGHAYYRRLTDPPPWPMLDAASFDSPPDRALSDLYGAELLAARDRLLTAPAAGREIGAIPLPCSTGRGLASPGPGWGKLRGGK